MNRSDWKYGWYLVLVLLLGMFALWGCPKKTEVAATPEAVATPPEPQRVEAPVAKPQDEPVKEQAAPAVAGLQPVYFDFDQAVVRPEAGEIMKANAEWLKAHPGVKIKIEGNCDERGTREYNQALGQRRAVSAKSFLTDLGISSNRISLISYGKETPSCTESSERCWQKNRRDDFIVVAD